MSSGSSAIKGTVKWFNNAKGFGFIEHPSGRDVFVHYSVIEASGFKTLSDGEEVEYELKEGPKGLQAVRVQRVIVAGSEGGESDSSDSGDESSESTENASEKAQQQLN